MSNQTLLHPYYFVISAVAYVTNLRNILIWESKSDYGGYIPDITKSSY